MLKNNLNLFIFKVNAIDDILTYNLHTWMSLIQRFDYLFSMSFVYIMLTQLNMISHGRCYVAALILRCRCFHLCIHITKFWYERGALLKAVPNLTLGYREHLNWIVWNSGNITLKRNNVSILRSIFMNFYIVNRLNKHKRSHKSVR